MYKMEKVICARRAFNMTYDLTQKHRNTFIHFSKYKKMKKNRIKMKKSGEKPPLF